MNLAVVITWPDTVQVLVYVQVYLVIENCIDVRDRDSIAAKIC